MAYDAILHEISADDFVLNKQQYPDSVLNIQDFMKGKKLETLVINDCNGKYYMFEVSEEE